ncbi:hypothetical protein FPSE_02465 [Fusarium pseudograminearum CS3096]|uniref:Uncharacterized protein n=1 Tax=Fusarium pseudograminearum (strain CS3096) TaxID=1028729 RepID=K3VPS7_FUSPC|nr:hypothetical protein FPSE_02465 [Fusarium pseudograminearum CS3096]EKJ77387.1 hypothetical protein FPSE_02465 [Fusarium pseudograminearum CS3096]
MKKKLKLRLSLILHHLLLHGPSLRLLHYRSGLNHDLELHQRLFLPYQQSLSLVFLTVPNLPPTVTLAVLTPINLQYHIARQGKARQKGPV